MAPKESEIKHRISVQVDKELYQRIQNNIPWGSLSHVVVAMLKDLMYICEQHDPHLVIGAVLSEDITLKDFLNKFGDGDGNSKQSKE